MAVRTCVSRECTMDTARLSRTIVGFPDPLRHTKYVMKMGHRSRDFITRGIRVNL